MFLSTISIFGCGFNGNQKVTQDGQSYIYLVVKLDFIEQVRQLCQDSLLKTDYSTEELWKQAISQCTFKNLSFAGISTSQANNFSTQYCQANSNLSSFSPQDQANITAACKALGF